MNEKMYDELVQGLLSILSDKTVQIVLYGSVARGTAQPESDIDIALFVKQRLTPEQEEYLNSWKI